MGIGWCGTYTKRFFNQADVDKYFSIIGSVCAFETSMTREEEEYAKPKVLYQIKVKKGEDGNDR